MKFPQHVQNIAELKTLFLNYGIDQNTVRFFIEPDHLEPRMFAIYKDGEQFVVFKSKDNGQVVERYRGKDEYKAVNILYDRFLEECRNRPSFRKYLPNNYDDFVIEREGNSFNTKKAKQNKKNGIRLIFVGAISMMLIGNVALKWINHDIPTTLPKDGYYIKDNDQYFCHNNHWYRYHDNDWIIVDSYLNDYDDYIYYDDYDSSVIFNDFYSSDYYNNNYEIIEDPGYGQSDYSHDNYNRNDNDNDYDDFNFNNFDWDFGSSDWGSDW